MLNLDKDLRGGTCCLSKAGLQLGTTDDKDVDIAAPNGAGIDYAINGIIYHKADTDSAPITAGHEIAADYTAIILVLIDSAGTVSSVMGTAVPTANVTAGADVLVFPEPTANTCPIGFLQVSNGSASTWTSGTDEFDASDITTYYRDLFTVPVAPLSTLLAA